MPYPYAQGVLAVLADPRYYPHVERHLYALLQVCEQVEVLAVFPVQDAMPSHARVRYTSVAEALPGNMGGFARNMKNIFCHLRRIRADLVEAIDPPALVPAALFQITHAFRLVYFSMEIFPELPSLVHRPLKRWIWRVLEQWSARRAQAVLSVNTSVAAVISHNLGNRPVGVVRSIPWTQAAAPLPPPGLRERCAIASDAPLLVYQGVVEDGRGLVPLADVLRDRPGVHLAIMGYGPLAKWVRSRAMEQANIHFLGTFPFNELMLLSREATAGVVCIEPLSRSFELSLPGKLFEYVGNGLPVLGSPLPEIAAHIKNAGVGEVASSWSVADLGTALDKLLKGIADGCYTEPLRHAAAEWNWEKESEKLCQAYRPDSACKKPEA